MSLSSPSPFQPLVAFPLVLSPRTVSGRTVGLSRSSRASFQAESRPPTTDPVRLGRVPKRMPYVTDEETRSLLGPESCHLSFDVAALYPVGGVPCLRFRSSEVSDLRRPSSLEGLLRGWVASATPRFTLAGSDSICWVSSMVGEARYL